MKKASIQTLATKMKNLDFCMMVTHDGNDNLHSRPMSNNGKVEYDGNSYFFTYADSNKVKHIERHPSVSLIYQTDKMLFIECHGKASVITRKSILEEKWTDGLNRWFPEGIDTPGICLIRVEASRVQFWDNDGDGEYRAAPGTA